MSEETGKTSNNMADILKKRWVIISVTSLFGLFIVIGLITMVWASSLNHTIRERLSGKRWAAPTEFYSAPERFIKGQSHALQTLTGTMERLEYKLVLVDRILRTGEYARWTADICRQKVQGNLPSEVVQCWAWRPHVRADAAIQLAQNERPVQVVAVSNDDIIYEVYEGEPPQPTPVIELEPELFAQFYGGQPVLRRIISLGDVPPHVLNAILAAEDSNFLSHHGVSWTGMMRAALRNIVKGHVAEGGSTITQQLIKNYFLDSRRTFKRKITEILMALLLESQFSKDDILETYINEVYLGQDGPFEIHGIGVASKYLFNKSSEDLTVAEGALVAGIIRGPNIYSPFTHPDRSKARRDQVLKRMRELGLIEEPEYQAAIKEPLPLPREHLLRDLAPFFVDAVKFQLHKMKIPDAEGLQVFTTLNLRAQRAATEAVSAGVAQIEKQYAHIQKLEKKYNSKLEASLIAADPTNGFVQAVVGGRAYTETQLNRAVQSRRQVGSVFKPFVFLAAFSSSDPNGSPYTPITPVLDETFTVTYDRQSWSPQNFDNEYMGNVPLYKALEHSLNAATSKVALQVGLQKIMNTAQRAGIGSPMTPFPSLALGAAALTPFEVLQSYSTLARRGELNPLTFIYKIVGPGHNVLYEFQPARTQALDAVETRETVGLMEGVIDRGTGQAIRASGFTHPAAGKTGTTSDMKDAWFAGFTPLHAAVVWVGFDQPQPTGLTGALGAIPIWTNYMKSYAATYPPIDFAVPDGAVRVAIDPESGMVATDRCPQKVPLVFRKGQEPTASCWLSH